WLLFVLDSAGQTSDWLFFFRRQHRQDWFVAAAAVFGAVEERIELIILLLRKRIVLVVVALGTLHGRGHPDVRRRVDSIDDGGVPELLVVGAAFGVDHGV